jgi:hypothetical protein
MTDGVTAILRDERDLLWIVLDDVKVAGKDLLYDVHFLARNEPDSAPEPFMSTFGHREPSVAFCSLLEEIGRAVAGEVRALRHDPVNDGLSLELKSRVEGSEIRYEVTTWLDLIRMNRAMKSRAVRGRQQSGVRMMTSRAALESFRSDLIAFADPPSGRAE